MLTVVTTMDGIADRLIPVERFKEAVITLDYSSEIEPEKLAKKLVAMGFVRTGMSGGQRDSLQYVVEL